MKVIVTQKVIPGPHRADGVEVDLDDPNAGALLVAALKEAAKLPAGYSRRGPGQVVIVLKA